jgi:hypothetical protein
MVAKDLDLPRYRPSGAVHLTILPAAAAGLVAAAILGIIYGILSKLNPFVIIDVALVFGLGFVVGIVGRFACHYAHCRNRLVALAVTIAFGLVALAASYWIEYRTDATALAKGSAFSFEQWIEMKKQTGWIIKGGLINGPFVFMVWVAEAFFVLAFASLLGWQAGEEPYCEQCRAWPKSHCVHLKGHTADEFWNAARAGTPLAVLQLPKTDRADISLVLDGRVCDKCHNGFLNIDEEKVTTENGKTRTVRKPLVHGVVMDQRNCESFLAAPPEAV